MSDSPLAKLSKRLGLSESFKLSKPKSSERPKISRIWLLLPATAVALVSFLTIPIQSTCACGGGAGGGKSFVGTLQRAQQAYFLDRNSFATSLAELDIGLPPQTKNYHIVMRATETAAFHYAVPKVDGVEENKSIANILFDEKSKQPLHGFVSAVFVEPTNPGFTQIILCMANVPGMVQPDDPIVRDGVPTCAPGTHPL